MEETYNRASDLLKSYWENIRGNDTLPPESKVDPDALAEIWEDSFLVQLTPDGLFRYDFLGKHLVEAYGDIYAQDEIARLVSPGSHRLNAKFSDVVARKSPVYDEGTFTDSHHLRIDYRQLLLPLGNDARGVTHILGTMKWRAS